MNCYGRIDARVAEWGLTKIEELSRWEDTDESDPQAQRSLALAGAQSGAWVFLGIELLRVVTHIPSYLC